MWYNDTNSSMKQPPKKVIFLITKATWGDASWETHGFPNPSFTGKQVFSRPLSSLRPILPPI